MAWTQEKALTYAEEAQSAVLATVTEGGPPEVRHVGGYGIVTSEKGAIFYLNTGKDSAKVTQIARNPSVSLIFQHGHQDGLKNVTLYGKARLAAEEERPEAEAAIHKRRPQAVFDDTKVIVKVQVEKIKVLDFSEEVKVQEIKL